jgi:hypothetical protein
VPERQLPDKEAGERSSFFCWRFSEEKKLFHSEYNYIFTGDSKNITSKG